MKKVLTYLLILGIPLVIALSFHMENKAKENIVLSDDIQAWYDLTEGDQPVATVIAQSWCSHCAAIKPYMEEIEAEYNVKIYWYDVDLLNSSDASAITDRYPRTYNGTPHVFVTKSGKLVDEIAGEAAKDDYISFFKTTGIISE